MVCGEAPSGSPGREVTAEGMLGLSEVVREGKEGCGEGGGGIFLVLGGDFSQLCRVP